jgi:hypothetical protein
MMQAGKYYIGDLCYVMDDRDWDEFCGITIKDNQCLDGEFEMKDGRKFATYGTMWGDGSYRSNIGTEHCVDAGLIGCIRVEDIRAEKYENIEELGAIVEFKEPFTTAGGRHLGRDWDGEIRFGIVRIETNPSDNYDYDEYDLEEQE